VKCVTMSVQHCTKQCMKFRCFQKFLAHHVKQMITSNSKEGGGGGRTGSCVDVMIL